MQHYLAVLTVILMMGLVIIRAATLKKKGIVAMQFGKLDKTDFLLPPHIPVLFLSDLCIRFRSPNTKY